MIGRFRTFDKQIFENLGEIAKKRAIFGDLYIDGTTLFDYTRDIKRT